MSNFKVGAIMDGVKTLKDRTIKITFQTQEMSPEDAADCMRLNQSFGWLIFAPENAGQVTIPDEPPPEFKNTKTPSARMRAVLFVYWQQLGGEGGFETFYREKMEMMINWVKEKLDQ